MKNKNGTLYLTRQESDKIVQYFDDALSWEDTEQNQKRRDYYASLPWKYHLGGRSLRLSELSDFQYGWFDELTIRAGLELENRDETV